MVQERGDLTPFATVIQALRTGLELTTRHWWLILLPLALDCLLWIGPRLSLADLGRTTLDWWIVQAQQVQPAAPWLQENVLAVLRETVGRLNLLTQLSAPIVGVPVLLNGPTLAQTPWTPPVWPVRDARALLTNWLALTVVGVCLSAFYFSAAARVVHPERFDRRAFVVNLAPAVGRVAGLLLLIVLILSALGLPLFVLVALASLASPAFGLVIALAGSMVLMWGLIFLSFSLYALFYDGVSPLRALRSSLTLVQRHFPWALSLLLGLYLIENLSSTLWLAADDGSWLTLVSLIGHAYIATALVLATFVFYRDRSQLLIATAAPPMRARRPSPPPKP